MAELKHEYDDHGNHRIAAVSPRLVVSSGEWVTYHNIASISFQNTTYIAVTDYFCGGMLIPDKIYKVEEVGK